MKKKYLFIVIVGLFLNLNSLNGQTQFWTGPITTVTKANFADWTLDTNQDRITSNVWLTRADSKGLFNIAPGKETAFDIVDYLSPLDTEWANGTIADGIENLTFDTWDVTNFSVNPAIGQNKVVHLITDDIYIDIVITSWTKGDGSGNSGGGGFSYERSTDQNLGINEFELNKALHVFPNPSQDFIQITGLTNAQNFKMHNILGVKVLQEKIEPNKKIDIKNFAKGIYFIHFENGTTLKFIKQ